jgi:hypothetical protein
MHRHDSSEVPGLLPNLVAHLKPGWKFESGMFVDKNGERIDPSPLLAEGSRVEPMVPGLQERAPKGDAEENLARYFHIVFPAGTQVDNHLTTLRGLPCFDDVRRPAEISLPENVGSPPRPA